MFLLLKIWLSVLRVVSPLQYMFVTSYIAGGPWSKYLNFLTSFKVAPSIFWICMLECFVISWWPFHSLFLCVYFHFIIFSRKDYLIYQFLEIVFRCCEQNSIICIANIIDVSAANFHTLGAVGIPRNYSAGTVQFLGCFHPRIRLKIE